MRTAAVIAWIVTAGGGLTMVAIWVAKGGLRQEDRELTMARSRGAAEPATATHTNLSHWMVATHALLAVSGLGLFVFYLRVGTRCRRASSRRRGWPSAPSCSSPARGRDGPPLGADRKAQAQGTGRRRRSTAADQAIPAVIVAAHGLAAAVTIVLVLLVALRVGT
jgi:hypothetical protein